jgi:hypothetical protein
MYSDYSDLPIVEAIDKLTIDALIGFVGLSYSTNSLAQITASVRDHINSDPRLEFISLEVENQVIVSINLAAVISSNTPVTKAIRYNGSTRYNGTYSYQR